MRWRRAYRGRPSRLQPHSSRRGQRATTGLLAVPLTLAGGLQSHVAASHSSALSRHKGGDPQRGFSFATRASAPVIEPGTSELDERESSVPTTPTRLRSEEHTSEL